MVEPQPAPPTPAQLDRARPFVYKAIKDNNLENLINLFEAGYPRDRIIFYPSSTPFMFAAS